MLRFLLSRECKKLAEKNRRSLDVLLSDDVSINSSCINFQGTFHCSLEFEFVDVVNF